MTIFRRAYDGTQPVRVEQMHGNTFNGEDGAHQFIITGVPTGTVKAYMMRADGTTCTVDGTNGGGTATVTLNKDCYNVPGRFTLSIFVGDTGARMCVYACVGIVYRTRTETIIDSGDVVPSLDDLIDMYDDVRTAAAAAEAATDTALSVSALPGYLGQAMMPVPADDRVTLGEMAGGPVNPADGRNQASTYGCKTDYSAITGPVLFRLEPTAEMQSLLPQGVKWNIWKYSGSTTATAKYSLTGKNWTTVPVAIPYEGWSTEKIRIGFSSIDESIALSPGTNPDVAERHAAIRASIKFYSLTDTTLTTSGAAADAKATGDALATLDASAAAKPRISLSMFQTVGVIGDSFASGHLDTTSGDNYAQSWVQVLARHYGFDAANYSRGGIKAAEWLTHANGLSKMQGDIPRQLYFIALGINDATAGTDLTAFKSTLTEIAGDVRAHSPSAVLCFITLARLGTSANHSAYLPYSNAISEVATAVGGLLIRSETLPVVDSSFWPRYSGHPTAPEYAALAEAYGRAFEAAALEAQTTLDSFNSIEPIMNVRALKTEADVPLVWEQGMITTSGSTGDSTLRCRTVGAMAPQAYSDLGFTLTIPAGLKAYIYTYIGTPNYSGFAGAYIAAWQTGEVSINIPAGRYIKLNGAKLDDSAVTPSDMAGFTLKRRGYTDTTLSKPDKAADAKAVGDRLDAAETDIDALETQTAALGTRTTAIEEELDGYVYRDPYRRIQWVPNGGASSSGEISSLTVVGDKLFVFKYATNNDSTTGNKIYSFNPDGTVTATGDTFTSNIGHANSVDWSPTTHYLVSPRQPRTGDVEQINALYLFPNVTAETRAFDTAASGVVRIDIDTSITKGGDAVFGQYRLNACWGPDDLGKGDMLYVISDDSNSSTSGTRHLALLQLGKGAYVLTHGTAVSGATTDQFNGTFNVVSVWTRPWEAVNGVSEGNNDMTYWGGKIYELPAPTATAGFPLMIHSFDDFGATWRTERFLIPYRNSGGTAAGHEKEGIAIYGGHIYMGSHGFGLHVLERS